MDKRAVRCRMRRSPLVFAAGLFLAACVADPAGPGAGSGATGDAAEATLDSFSVLFETTAGDFTIDVTPDWAPNGAARFAELVDEGFYDGCRFFRVVPGFMVQFGINGDPAVHALWRSSTIPDDSVSESNQRGYVTFAHTGAADSRTTQLFINYGDNGFLDSMVFAPFGVVRDGGMNAVDAINAEYGELPDQASITAEGTTYLDANFPNLDYIVSARRLP